MLRRWRAAWPRRGRFWGPPWPEGPQTVWRPGFIRRGIRLSLPAARGRFYGPLPPPAAAPPPGVPGWVRGRQRAAGGRRGAFHEPPWPQGPQNVWTPATGGPAQRARWLPPARRGEFIAVPPPQVAAAPSVWVPGFIQALHRLAGRPTRRGQFHEPPWPQGPQTVWTPAPFARRRPAGVPARRGRFTVTPPAPRAAGMPAFLRTRPRPVPSLARRGQFHEPRWVEGPQTVWRPPWRPQAGARLRFAAKLRRGRYFEPGWPQGEQAPLALRWEGSGGQLATHEATGGSGGGHEGSGGTATTWEGG